jgi:tRNA nucleotidyltransferase/poly(A) polymerase
MLKDQKDLLSAFNEHEVEYVVVGGHAVSAYGFSRMTKDLDILIRSTPENAKKVFRALAAFGAPLSTYTVDDFHDHPKDVIQFGIPPARIDILQSISAVEDADVWSSLRRMPVDGEMTVPFLSLESLIRNKLQAGRPRDLSDVDELKKVNGL